MYSIYTAESHYYDQLLSTGQHVANEGITGHVHPYMLIVLPGAATARNVPHWLEEREPRLPSTTLALYFHRLEPDRASVRPS